MGNRESGGKSRLNRTDKENCGNAVDEGARTWHLEDGGQGALTGLVATVHNVVDSSGVA